ncbi:carbohydrate ABC transporter membrane protein 1 (CUT1 family) [Saccharopolyspora erythraea NRRL 2338]|uniref:Binding-protein-dependent transport systems membrane component n=2 Tax=Saccharopolyspora erythraea TaxID=1836 RepID=A4F884_SACEN|nr:sugar ABC transporter permease [Saccharopolyspora erythraea]PFG94053.1 carbohydrate ABC transporter membrane protein 1 (CUT1 family) [Saccharopolyspora erythraea NRRL 2338]CAM00259.1 binding-protein-dependent transport systems membrane component [Saccharopolyspora erythraea NRRL 2338]
MSRTEPTQPSGPTQPAEPPEPTKLTAQIENRPVDSPADQHASEPARRRSRIRFGFEARMLTPGVLLLAALSVIPFLTMIVMSFSSVRLLGGVGVEWAGLRNWARLFTDPDLGANWLRTGVYFALTLGLEMLLGLVFALCVWRVMRGRNAVLSLFLLPMFVAPAIVGLLGRFLTDSTFGLYSWLLGALGYTGDILGGKYSAFAAVVLMDVWEWTPLITLIALAGLSSVPPSLREAAALDGANGWQSLRHIVLPSISNVLLVALLIRSMDAIRYFDIVWVTTGGGPADATKIVPVRLYETAFRFFDLGYAAVLGLVMLAVSIVIARAFVRLLDKKGQTR